MELTAWDVILIPTSIIFLILAFVTLNRYIAYKERVDLARLGFSLDDLSRDAAQMRRGNRGVLWGGVITSMSGLALLLGLATLGRGVWLLGGLLPLFVGIGMVLIYFVTLGAQSPERSQPQEGEPGEAEDAPAFDAEAPEGAGVRAGRARED